MMSTLLARPPEAAKYRYEDPLAMGTRECVLELLAAGGRFARLWRAGELEPPAEAESDDTDVDSAVAEVRSA